MIVDLAGVEYVNAVRVGITVRSFRRPSFETDINLL